MIERIKTPNQDSGSAEQAYETADGTSDKMCSSISSMADRSKHKFGADKAFHFPRISMNSKFFSTNSGIDTG